MIEHEASWFAGKRVFLTGHTGFKGAWLSLWLQQMQAEVTGFALAPDTPSMFEAARVGEGMNSIIGNICDHSSLKQAIASSKPEIILHMAAQSLVRRSYADPVGTFAVNVLGTANLLDCARHASSVAAVVIVTSDKCYDNTGHGRPFREGDPMGGNDPYSASKGCAELVSSAFARSFFSTGGVAVASARAGNVIGGGDWAEDRLVPDLMRGAMSGKPVMVRRPTSVRPWQFVLEPLRGYLTLARRLVEKGAAFSGGWNFGPNPEDVVPVRTVVERVRSAWPALEVEYAAEKSGPEEAEALRLDCAKAEASLGWRPVLNLDEAVQWTVDWHRAVHERASGAGEVAQDQVRLYQSRLGALVAGS